MIRTNVIVMTHNRPQTLMRALRRASGSMGANDSLTILDDSDSSIATDNAGIAAALAHASSATMSYLPTGPTLAALRKTLPSAATGWMSRTSPRDIAPLRNLSLLISYALKAETTLLLDDDIDGFDVAATTSLVDSLSASRPEIIAGADMRGTIERDTITRLAESLPHLLTRSTHPPGDLHRLLFRVPNSPPSPLGGDCRHVSGGYLAFRLREGSTLAFPPGYNEDWLWCLLQRHRGTASVVRTGQTVHHDPPELPRSTSEDLVFELLGDLVFDCLEDLPEDHSIETDDLLDRLSLHSPPPDWLPAARAQELLDQIQATGLSGPDRELLGLYGLTAVEQAYAGGHLEIDAGKVLRQWCCDAQEKQRSFEAASDRVDTIRLLRHLTKAGIV